MSMRLTRGTIAPTFEVEDYVGSKINLSKLRGQWILLSFFRNAACALCNLRVHEMIQRFPDYARAGLTMVAIFEAAAENIRQYVGKQAPPFSIVADPQARLYDLYALESSQEKVLGAMEFPEVQARVKAAGEAGFALTPEPDSNFFRLHGDFLIDPMGVIRLVDYAEVIGRHLDFTEIERSIGM